MDKIVFLVYFNLYTKATRETDNHYGLPESPMLCRVFMANRDIVPDSC